MMYSIYVVYFVIFQYVVGLKNIKVCNYIFIKNRKIYIYIIKYKT